MTSVEHDASGTRLVFGDGLPFGHEVASASRYDPGQLPTAELCAARKALTGLLESEEPLDISRCESINYNLREELLGDEFTEKGITKWNPRMLRVLRRANNRQLQQFCEWNVTQHECRETAMESATFDIREQSLIRADRLIGLNIWPRTAMKAVETAIDAAGSLRCLDSFEAGGMLANGYCDFSEDRLGLANRFHIPGMLWGISPSMYTTGFHEYTHLAGKKAGGGFMKGLTAPAAETLPGYRLLEEAWVSYTSDVAATDEAIAATYSGLNWNETMQVSSYEEERDFVGTVLAYGDYPVDIEQVAEAYFDELGITAARRGLHKRLNRSLEPMFPEFGYSTFDGMSAAYETVSLPERPGLLADWQQRLHAALGTDRFSTMDLTEEAVMADADTIRRVADNGIS